MKKQLRLLKQKYLQNFVFIHINKTAGSSIEKALKLRFEHKTALQKRTEIGEELWQDKFVFGFVRNPWDKVVSHYHYRVRTNQTGLGDNHLSFEDWVRKAYGDNDPVYYDLPTMFMPQTNWLVDDQGELIVTFIGRFENLTDDFRTVCSQIGRHAELPHVKSSKRADYQRYYSDETREIIATWFAEDVRRFDYRFEESE